jgi:hypothetical protein
MIGALFLGRIAVAQQVRLDAHLLGKAFQPLRKVHTFRDGIVGRWWLMFHIWRSPGRVD